MNAGSWCKLCQTGRNHIFCMNVFVLCCLVLLPRAGHLTVSWLMTAHRYMLELLGDVTSTVSSCQLFRGCVLPNNLCAYILMLCMGLLDLCGVKLLHICISFVHVLFHFMYKFISLPPWNRYIDSIVPLHMHLFASVPVNLSSQILVNNFSSLFCTPSNQCC